MLGAKDINIREAVKEVLEKEKITVSKVLRTGAQGPIQFLVRQVQKKINRTGDPEEIKSLIMDELDIEED